MIPVAGENCVLTLIPVKQNSKFEYDTNNIFYFKGRPASPQEKKTYRLQAGVNTSTDGIYIYATNMPKNIKPGDKVKFLGKTQVVESVGYYYNEDVIINESLFSEEYIVKRCPKGITLNK